LRLPVATLIVILMKTYQHKKQQPWQTYIGQHRFYLYEGNDDSRDESDGFNSSREAIKAAKIHLRNAWDMGFRTYTVHVIDRKTTEFIHTGAI
jgi:hypothetical protein